MALYKGSTKVSWSAGVGFAPENSWSTWQVLTKTNDWMDWETPAATWVISSNNTYEDMIHLSQADYDALVSPDPDTFYSTPDDESWAFEPENEWTIGQVLTKTATGYEWQGWWDTPEVIEEKIVYKMNADGSGNLYIPTAWAWWWGYNSYDWQVSVDGWAATQYTWTWSNWSMITLSWYTANSNHTIKIEPTTEAYWWARAFWGIVNATYGALATEIVYDKTYKWFATSATDTGSDFRRYQYYYWTNIKNIPEEYLPDTVTTVWNYFRYWQYRGCSSLGKASDEIMPDTVTSIWKYFRYEQYHDCTNIKIAWKECLSNNITTITESFRRFQYSNTALRENPIEVMWDNVTSIWDSFRMQEFYGCKFLKNASNEYIPSSVTTIWDSFRSGQYRACFSLIQSAKECLPSSVTTIWGGFRSGQYNWCANLVCISWWIDRSITVWGSYRNSQFSKKKSTNINVLVIWSPWNVSADSNVFYNNTVTVYAEDSTKQTELQNSTYQPRSSISDSNIYSLI